MSHFRYTYGEMNVFEGTFLNHVLMSLSRPNKFLHTYNIVLYLSIQNFAYVLGQTLLLLRFLVLFMKYRDCYVFDSFII